jgi:hypothetical protein
MVTVIVNTNANGKIHLIKKMRPKKSPKLAIKRN